LNARHYDPGMARFLEVDTYTGELNDPLSLNLYTYCHNEPLMYSDPSGHYEGEREYLKNTTLSTAMGGMYVYEVETLQRDLSYLGIYKGQPNGFFNGSTETAVNIFKDKWLHDGNVGKDVRGKVGATTKLFIKREVDLKDIYGLDSSNAMMRRAIIWSEFNANYSKIVKPKPTAWSKSGNTIHYGKQTIAQAYNKSPTKKVLSEPERKTYLKKGMTDTLAAQKEGIKEGVKAVVNNPVGALKDYYTDPETYLRIAFFPEYDAIKQTVNTMNGISSRIEILSSGDVNAIYYQLGSDVIIVEEQGIMMIVGEGLFRGLKLPSKGTKLPNKVVGKQGTVSAVPIELTEEELMQMVGGSSGGGNWNNTIKVKVSDLKNYRNVHELNLSKVKKLQSLTDEQLLNSFNNPADGTFVTINDLNGISQGHHRINEMLNRMNNPNSMINGNMIVTVEKRTRNLFDYFFDLD